MMAALRSMRLVACLVAAMAFGAGNLWAQSVVTEIVVLGNQRIEPETITSYMTIRAGDPYDVGEVDDSLKSLFETGLFADVAIRREGTALIVQVVENPIINRIAFEGNRALTSEDLEAEIQLQPRTVYTRNKVRADVTRIRELYRHTGRFNTVVDPKVVLQDQNRIDLIFEISEGDVTVVRQIAFIGNEGFSDSTLADAIITRESAWYRFLSADDTYDPDRLAFDQELLRRYYLARGYADFRVVSVSAELTADRSEFFITFTVEEGDRYEFDDVAITSELRGVEAADVEDLVSVETGDWYDAEAIEDDILEITLELGNRGFPAVEIEPKIERDTENLTIDLEYVIRQGEALYIERIDIVGNIRTADEVIRREFRLSEGDAFNLALLQRSERQIRALDYFNNVTVMQLPGSEPDSVIINVEVEEKSTGELSFGIGFSTSDNALFNISLRERNLLGEGQNLSLDLLLSGRRQTIDLGFTEPYFLDRDVAAGFDVYRRREDLQTQSSYEQESTGGVLRMSYPVTEHLRHFLYYSFEKSVIEDVGASASALVREQEGTSTRSVIGERLQYDRRDDVFNPTTGYILQQRLDIAGLGGSERFLRNRLSASYFHPFDVDLTGNLRAEAGIITGIAGRDVSIADRFYLGGSRLRGFEPAGLGPRDLETDDALGGNVFWTTTAELAFPLGLPRELGFTGRVFTDWGSLFDLDQSGENVVDKGSPRGSVGFGFSYNSPLGPLQFDFSSAVAREDYDNTEFFRFSFGTAF